jgi:dephospho-CoA kinase
MVFDNDNLLDELNRLVHPAVKRHFLNWAGKQRSAYVIQEAAILFENGSYKDYDKMILVTAPLKLRMDRLKERDGSSEAQIKARMKKQWKDSKKSDLTDFIIHNTDLKRTKSQVDRIHKKLLKTSRWGQF